MNAALSFVFVPQLFISEIRIFAQTIIVMRQLHVYVNDTFAGTLTEAKPGRDYTFAYDETYLASDGPDISVTLPKRAEPYTSKTLFPFFCNNLPEGANRRMICRYEKIDERDLFSLLVIMADQDCIGAVQVRKIKDDGK